MGLACAIALQLHQGSLLKGLYCKTLALLHAERWAMIALVVLGQNIAQVTSLQVLRMSDVCHPWQGQFAEVAGRSRKMDMTMMSAASHT
jgi:hypothetical protein